MDKPNPRPFISQYLRHIWIQPFSDALIQKGLPILGAKNNVDDILG